MVPVDDLYGVCIIWYCTCKWGPSWGLLDRRVLLPQRTPIPSWSIFPFWVSIFTRGVVYHLWILEILLRLLVFFEHYVIHVFPASISPWYIPKFWTIKFIFVPLVICTLILVFPSWAVDNTFGPVFQVVTIQQNLDIQFGWTWQKL